MEGPEAHPQREYTITFFKPTDYKDVNGNWWCDAAVEGVSEPMKWVVKDPTAFAVGQSHYGHITHEAARNGRPYLRFRRLTPPEGGSHATQSNSNRNTSNYTPRDDAAIRAQWAIGQATQANLAVNKNDFSWGHVETDAKSLFEMVDRVKGSSESTGLAAEAEAFLGKQIEEAKTGYDKFKASRPTPKPEPTDEDAEFASMMAKGLEADGINPDDIPF